MLLYTVLIAMKTITTIFIKKKDNENSSSLLRRFQKKVQESGNLNKVRSLKFATRELSDLKTKRAKLKKLAGAEKYARAKRLGIPLNKVK